MLNLLFFFPKTFLILISTCCLYTIQFSVCLSPFQSLSQAPLSTIAPSTPSLSHSLAQHLLIFIFSLSTYHPLKSSDLFVSLLSTPLLAWEFFGGRSLLFLWAHSLKWMSVSMNGRIALFLGVASGPPALCSALVLLSFDPFCHFLSALLPVPIPSSRPLTLAVSFPWIALRGRL